MTLVRKSPIRGHGCHGLGKICGHCGPKRGLNVVHKIRMPAPGRFLWLFAWSWTVRCHPPKVDPPANLWGFGASKGNSSPNMMIMMDVCIQNLWLSVGKTWRRLLLRGRMMRRWRNEVCITLTSPCRRPMGDDRMVHLGADDGLKPLLVFFLNASPFF